MLGCCWLTGKKWSKIYQKQHRHGLASSTQCVAASNTNDSKYTCQKCSIKRWHIQLQRSQVIQLSKSGGLLSYANET